jgi:hypothetical protein
MDTTEDSTKGPNPRRVIAGRLNRTRRGPLTEGGREKLRETALRNRPWLHSTGPRTQQGKARAAMNGKARQKGELSIRELRATLSDVGQLVRQMRETRARLRQTDPACRSPGH